MRFARVQHSGRLATRVIHSRAAVSCFKHTLRCRIDHAALPPNRRSRAAAERHPPAHDTAPAARSGSQQPDDGSELASVLQRTSPDLLGALLALPPGAALAEAVAYNPDGGSEVFKTAAGVAYIGLVIFYFVRLFKRRAEKATSERIAAPPAAATGAGKEDISDDEEEVAVDEEPEVTPLQCFIGFAQAGTICYLLYLVSTSIDGFFAAKELPQQYTARNIAVLVSTVVRGLSYLITFIFGANAAGLAALGLQLVVAPEAAGSGGRGRQGQRERLPDVKITDDLFAIRRAFKEAEQMGRRDAERKGGGRGGRSG